MNSDLCIGRPQRKPAGRTSGLRTTGCVQVALASSWKRFSRRGFEAPGGTPAASSGGWLHISPAGSVPAGKMEAECLVFHTGGAECSLRAALLISDVLGNRAAAALAR